jgi:hypothetical protein
VARKYAIITLFQIKESQDSVAKLRKQIEKAIASSSLKKSWKMDHVAFVEEPTKKSRT